MQEINNLSVDNHFDDDPQKKLRIENEILKLKLRAERGGSFYNVSDDLPPEIEALFLKNIQLFEESFDNAKEMSVFECVGKPEFKKVTELSTDELPKELQRLMELLSSNNIALAVFGEYEPSMIYQFITEELFTERTRQINVPGYINHFVYEDFHPNHRLDI